MIEQRIPTRRHVSTKHTRIGLLLAFGFSAACWAVMLWLAGVL